MAAAALAYKCMEVAYMRVIYSSHNSASRDRHELQTALQIVPLGESPSSSASDVDNVNNSTTAEKCALPKGVSSPQVAGTHVISARNRPYFVRLLNFAQDVNFAMEASRKSRIAFAAANSSSGEGKHAEGVSSIKKALDFNFHDVEGLLRLVRLAMEAINR
ncbi:CW-type Zinc Finger, putative isoform 1 [Senna tora]|uniref:CW-type Zinc Finger, putative isoform 1 n=1 Tax=Senna tora TaxID=362788 RepID=A0A834SWI3_9FABA|nr:CW-type Zinc Finger, putative isoform 1 [Senna tora]